MVFSSYIFVFIFLPITLLGYFLIKDKWKNGWILLASFIFYSWNGPRYTLVLFGSIFINWMGAYLIEKFNHKHRKHILVSIISLNLILLIYFKYANFIVDNIQKITGRNFLWEEVVLPLGISFFTFQGMSYVIDVYRKDVKAFINPFNVALYISLFPQLVAGPIVRSKDVAEEIVSRKSDVESIGEGFRRFIYGLAKKIILADVFGQIADQILNVNMLFEVSWLAIIAYTLQIYYDFSGYSDMAIGLGKIFGFHFRENFNYPYVSKSITEFWKRWHISLSSWFRDYVYIPLGGNRVRTVRHIGNVFLVWILTGIWHGANWTFIFWGIYYGILLIGEKYIFSEKIRERVPKGIRHLLTMLCVMIGWVLFRAENLQFALQWLQSMFCFEASTVGRNILIRTLINYRFFWIIGCIGVLPVKNLVSVVRQKMEIRDALWDILENIYICFLIILSLWFLISSSYNAFIYFQF